MEQFVKCGGALAMTFWMEDQRRLVDDPECLPVRGRNLRHVEFRAAMLRSLPDALVYGFMQSTTQRPQELRGVRFCVPDLQWVHFRETIHVLAVPSSAGNG